MTASEADARLQNLLERRNALTETEDGYEDLRTQLSEEIDNTTRELRTIAVDLELTARTRALRWEELTERERKVTEAEAHLQKTDHTSRPFPNLDDYEDMNSSRQSGKSSRLLKIAKPQTFNTGGDLDFFLEQFEEFVNSCVGAKAEEDLHNYFLTLIKDRKLHRKLKSTELTPEERRSVKLLVAAYKRKLYTEADVINLRNSIVLMKQKPGELVEDFGIRIEVEVEKAYANAEMRNQTSLTTFLNGLINIEVKKDLMKLRLNCFEKAKEEGKSLEAIHSNSTAPLDELHILKVDTPTPPPIKPKRETERTEIEATRHPYHYEDQDYVYKGRYPENDRRDNRRGSNSNRRRGGSYRRENYPDRDQERNNDSSNFRGTSGNRK